MNNFFRWAAVVLMIVLGLGLEFDTTLAVYRFFGSKTPYELVASDWDQLLNSVAQLPNSCQLIHLRVLLRHGTRSLSKHYSKTCKAAIEKLTNAGAQPVGMTMKELKDLEKWKNTLPTEDTLLPRGRTEHEFLSGDYFSLVNKSQAIGPRAEHFLFESTSVERAHESGLAFRSKWANLTSNQAIGNVTVNDRRNYFYKNCSAFQTRVAGNLTANAEFNRAGTTREADGILYRVNTAKLNISNVLNWDDVTSLYLMAATEMAAYNTSVLLPLFDQQDLAYLEYTYDMEEFWTTSYSVDDVTRQMNCILTNDIFETAEAAFKNEADGVAIEMPGMFSFSHSEAVQSLYGTFHLFYDPSEGYLADASRFFYLNRNYDTSEIGRFASNLAFLFYNCKDEPVPRNRLVMMTVNGKLQPFKDACPFESPCPLENVKRAYPLATGYPTKCDYDNVCFPTQKSSVLQAELRLIWSLAAVAALLLIS